MSIPIDDVESRDSTVKLDGVDVMDSTTSKDDSPQLKNRKPVEDYVADKVNSKSKFSPAELKTKLTTLVNGVNSEDVDSITSRISNIKNGVLNNLKNVARTNSNAIDKVFLSLYNNDRQATSKMTTGPLTKKKNNNADVKPLNLTEFDVAKAKMDIASNTNQEQSLSQIYSMLLKQDISNRSLNTKFYKKSLEYQYLHLLTGRASLDATTSGFNTLNTSLSYIIKNTSLPDTLKIRPTEAAITTTQNRLVNMMIDSVIGPGGNLSGLKNSRLAKPFGMVKNKINDLMFFGKSKVEEYADTIADGKSPISKYIKGKMKKTFSNVDEYLNNKEEVITPVSALNADELNKPAVLTNRTLITQNEVVPDLLSKIHRELVMIRTGSQDESKEAIKYDYENRMWSTKSKMTNDVNMKVSNVIKTSGIIYDLNTLAKFILNNSGVPYTPSDVKEVRNGFMVYVISGKRFYPHKLDEDFYACFNPNIALMMKIGIGRLMDDKNPNLNQNKTILRDSFLTIKNSIPSINKLVERQVSLGNTDILLEQNLITKDKKSKKYVINNNEYSKLLNSTLTQLDTNTIQMTKNAVETRTQDKNFTTNVDSSLTTDNSNIKPVSNKPTVDSKFTLNKSGTNSIVEKMAIDASRKLNVKPFKTMESEAYKEATKTYKDQFNGVKQTRVYKYVLSKLRMCNITDIQMGNVTTANLASVHTEVSNYEKSLIGTTEEITYKVGLFILEKLHNLKMVSDQYYNKRIDRLTLKFDSMSRPNTLKVPNRNTLENKEVGTEELSKDTVLTSVKNSVSSGTKLAKNNESKSIGILQSTLQTTVTKLGLEVNVSKLNKPSMLELLGIIKDAKTSNEAKLNVVSYLHGKGLVSDGTLQEELTDKPKEENGIRDKLNIMSTLKGILTAKVMQNTNYNIDKEKEDRKEEIKEIVSEVVTGLNKDKDKPKANDLDNDGLRDGSWMAKKPKKVETEKDIHKTVEKAAKESSSPLDMILKLLGMGIPVLMSGMKLLTKGISGIYKGVAGLAGSIISGLGSIIMSSIGGLGKKLFKGVGKLLGKGLGAVGLGGVADTAMEWGGKALSKIGGKEAIKGLGKGILKKIPILGALAGAGFALDKYMDGDIIGGTGDLVSGLVGSIPIIGIPGSIAVDYLTKSVKEMVHGPDNTKIDPNLYEGKSFDNINTDTADALTLKHIRKEETGSETGKYAAAKDIGDGAGISFGAYQLTEKSGNIEKYLKQLYSKTSDPLAMMHLQKFKKNVYTGNKESLVNYLKQTGDTNVGRAAQDFLFKNMYLDPAKELAEKYEIKDKASISQIVDHAVNAGIGGAARVIRLAAGDYSPLNIAKSRKSDYSNIISKNGNLAKYQKVWFGRVDRNAKLFTGYDGEAIATATAEPTEQDKQKFDASKNQATVGTTRGKQVEGNNTTAVTDEAGKLLAENKQPVGMNVVNNTNQGSATIATRRLDKTKPDAKVDTPVSTDTTAPVTAPVATAPIVNNSNLTGFNANSMVETPKEKEIAKVNSMNSAQVDQLQALATTMNAGNTIQTNALSELIAIKQLLETISKMSGAMPVNNQSTNRGKIDEGMVNLKGGTSF